MIKRIKQYPLVGLSLAIAAGFVLAHVVNEIGDHLWGNSLEDFLVRNGWMLADLTVAAGLLALVLWKRRSILNWLRNHKTTAARVLFGLTVGGLFAAEQGGKTYTAVAASGGSDYAARLAANRVAAMDLAFSSLFFCSFFFALKLIGVMNERRKSQKSGE